MKQSIYFRNFLDTALIVLISFTVLGGLSSVWNYRLMSSDTRAMISSTLHETARYIATLHMDHGVDVTDLNLSMQLAMLSGVSGFDLLITDVHGVVGSCSDRDFGYVGQTVPQQALDAAAVGSGAVTQTTLGNIFPESRQVAGTPLIINTQGEPHVFGYLFVSGDRTALRQ